MKKSRFSESQILKEVELGAKLPGIGARYPTATNLTSHCCKGCGALLTTTQTIKVENKFKLSRVPPHSVQSTIRLNLF